MTTHDAATMSINVECINKTRDNGVEFVKKCETWVSKTIAEEAPCEETVFSTGFGERSKHQFFDKKIGAPVYVEKNWCTIFFLVFINALFQLYHDLLQICFF